MNSKSKIGLCLLLVLILGGALWLTLGRSEPELTYQGKSLRVWLKGFDAAQGSPEYAAAEEALRQMGTNALPNLIRYLYCKDPLFHRQWIALRAKVGLLRGEVDYAMFWHRRAGLACGALGQEAAAAFPALTEAMNDPGAASDVGNGLSRMMPASVPVLTNILATGNVIARSRAADNLITAYSHREVEPMARTALIAALRDSNPGVRMTAASALQFWNTRLDLIVPELARTLSDPDPSVRGNAVTSLGNFQTNAEAAVPEILKLLADTNRYVSGTVGDRAMQMLIKINPQAAAASGAK